VLVSQAAERGTDYRGCRLRDNQQEKGVIIIMATTLFRQFFCTCKKPVPNKVERRQCRACGGFIPDFKLDRGYEIFDSEIVQEAVELANKFKTFCKKHNLPEGIEIAGVKWMGR
jgi:hypothetical protein